jgi:hypothetical protein
MAFGALTALQDQIRSLQQPGGPGRVETLKNTLAALIQTCLRHQNAACKQSKESSMAWHPEADAGCFWVRQGLCVETTPCNIDDDRKRPWPEHAGKALDHHTYRRLDPRQDTNDIRYKNGQRLGSVAMLCCEHSGNRRRTRRAASDAIDGIRREYYDGPRSNTFRQSAEIGV